MSAPSAIRSFIFVRSPSPDAEDNSSDKRFTRYSGDSLSEHPKQPMNDIKIKLKIIV